MHAVTIQIDDDDYYLLVHHLARGDRSPLAVVVRGDASPAGSFLDQDVVRQRATLAAMRIGPDIATLGDA